MNTRTCLLILVVSLNIIVPARGDVWQQVPSPSGGYVRGIITLSNGDMLAGVNRNGVYISKDQGQSWSKSPADMGITTVVDFAIANTGDVIAASWAGLFKSSDQGQSWSAINPAQLQNVWFYCITKTSNGNLYAGSWSEGVFLSTDNGATWQPYNSGLTDLAVDEVVEHPSGALFVGTRNGGVFRSDDSGATWTAKNNGIGGMEIYTLDFASDGTLYAGGYFKGLYSSNDMGETWTQVAPQNLYYYLDLIAVHTDGSIYIGGSSFGIMKSSDNGATWTLKSTGLWDMDVTYLHSAGNALYLGCEDVAMYKSVDAGASWQWAGKGIGYPSFRHLAGKAQNGYLFASSRDIAMSRSKDNGASWEYIHNNLYDNATDDFLVTPDGKLFCVAFGSGCYRSFNDGDSLEYAGTGQADSYPNCLFFNHKTNELLIGSYYGKISRSNNYGDSWVKSDSGMSTANIHDFAVDSQGHLFAATDKGLYHSLDGGKYWQQVDNGLGNGDMMTILITGDDYIFVGNWGSGIYRSKDHGASWELLDTGNKFSTQTGLLADSKGMIYVSSNFNGVYRSTDKGDTWNEYNSGLPSISIDFIALDHNGYLYAGVEYYGLYRTLQEVTGVVENRVPVPQNLTLLQNYPNPFNPGTQIQFSLNRAGMVEFAIYNGLGQQVQRFVKFYQQGSHSFSLDASGLPSGRYYIQLRTGDEKTGISMTKLQ
ncbi:T9SS type A sorting domain-containing protein [candidate division KSB1 bacterium]|nr:T9SS type A sorting domain-containing protein [candidate division KSB1 bacterium]